ncbi:glycosyltransferase family A protein [Paludicola sp. MB14-C6]|uniref:glycosyltransferase family 2 protein n=1 Tax=Paludihabitans sp. MB14-C6 TaxID=3070656 RepID=UPI0027DE274E|nr:glycosyltransferase family A protein [Paludicola sp. MB14-C6]WMJ23072.1 glycosyltransferase family A protein [Paludicola sp. MB14-C6]
MPFITVVVPVYNTSAYLNKCLDSLLNQDFKDYEILVINDGSTDNSLEILKEYENKFSNKISLITGENRGISAVRNTGIMKSKGEYICFIDSDDYVESTYFSDLYSAITNENADVAVCDFYEWNDLENTKTTRIAGEFTNCKLQDKPSLLFEINSSPWNKLYRKNMLLENKIEFPLNLKYEDAYFVLLALLKSNRIVKVNKPLVDYRVRENSETTNVNARVFDIFKILDLVNDAFKKDSSYNCYREALEFINANRVTVYCLQQVYQKQDDIINQFIDTAYKYMDSHFPSWRKNNYFKADNSKLEFMIKSSKMLTKLYVKTQRKIKGN